MNPRFGDRIMNTAASERNPIKRGIFVRRVVKTGFVNPGVWYELTDGAGKFWRVEAGACEIERETTA